MDTIKSFEEFLASSSVNIPLVSFVINLIISGIMGAILAWIYENFGSSLSNRRLFSRNFVLMTMTTMLIITIVKSSLALSLGLVGALSIIRFRAAIKEPEEISFLFVAIAIGLGLGANQGFITSIGFIIIGTFIVLRKNMQDKDYNNNNYYLTIRTEKPENISIENIVHVIKKHCDELEIKRFDSSKDIFEASFVVNFKNFNQLNATKIDLEDLHESINITYLDNEGLGL